MKKHVVTLFLVSIMVVGLLVVLEINYGGKKRLCPDASLISIVAVQVAVNSFGVAHGRLPVSLDELLEAEAGLGLRFKKVQQGVVDDGGRVIVFTNHNGRYRLHSSGMDCRFGTPDDVIVTGGEFAASGTVTAPSSDSQ
jgi:hypothetical protein